MNDNFKCYIIEINRRDGESLTIGDVYSTRELAIEKLKEYVTKKYSDRSIKSLIETYCGNPDDGEFYSEEESIQVIEKNFVTG